MRIEIESPRDWGDELPAMFKPGETVGEYTIVDSVGQGGFGHIFKARGPDGKLVILKFPEVSLLGDPATYERFRREVAVGQRLDHSAIPRVIAMKESREGTFLVLEYVEGKTLRRYIWEKAPLPLDEALSIACQLAVTLDYLHAHGISHRDLKPENIIIGPDGRIHIIDFGSALLRGTRRVTWGLGGNVLGTPDYMAPEQIQGKRGDARTDIYALGIILYELLTGTVPFHGDNALSVMNQHLTATPAPPRSLRAEIPPGVEAIVLKAIRRNPDSRYQMAGELTHDLEHYAELDLSKFPTGPEPALAGTLTPRQVLVQSLLIILAFLAFLVLILAIVYLLQHR
jgi:serine/threonine protein kinase